jgi:hypothetical protein
VVNPTFEPQSATVRLAGEVDAVVWDPSLGEERGLSSELDDGRTVFGLELGPTGSAFLVPQTPRSRSAAPKERGPSTTIALDGDWSFRADGPNALVIDRWLAVQEEPGAAAQRYMGADPGDDGWRPVVQGAWAYQLEREPTSPWPIPVWYRIGFSAEERPDAVRLVVDGFAGSDPAIYLNGERARAPAARSPFDAQMTTIDLTELVRPGANVLAVRLVLHAPTDGITDRVKLIGSFSVARGDDGAYGIVRPVERVKAASWTDQGYPFLSGVGVYRTTASLPDELGVRRVVLEAPAGDDVLEVVVNGSTAGVRLWPPYAVDVTELVRPGDNEFELRVANTLANLLNGDERPSGLAEAPRLLVVGPQR